MARDDALARVYARSLYELASEAGGPDKVLEIASELEQICELTREDRAFAEFLASPIIDRGKRSSALRSIFSDRITDLALRFILVVNEKGRLGHLEAMSAAYDHLVQEAHDRVEVDVFTAAPIDDEQARLISDRVRTVLGKEPVLHRYTDARMLGGLKLRIGDQLIDGSVSTRLRRLRQNLLTTGSATIRERIGRIVQEEGGLT